jgi:hypothetical protein
MAISFKDKIAYVNKFADKSDEKLQKVIKLSVNIESPKLNLTDAQKDKIKSSLETAFERIKKIEDEKGTTKVEGKKLKSPNLLQLTKQISQKQGITFEEARKKAKQAFAAKKSGQADAIQAVLKDFKKKVGKIEYSRATTYVSKGVTRSTDIKRDMERPALRAGKRKVTTQGSTTNAYGTFKNKVGKVYYESRANRMDINQPSKKRYPKLAKGAKIYSSDNAYKVQVMVDDKIVDEKIIRARNQREANMLAEEMDSIFTKKYGDHRVKVIEAMGDGGEFDDGGMTNFSDAYVIVKENRDEADDFEGLVFSEEDFSKWLAQKSEEEEEELDEDDYKLIRVSVYNPNKMDNGGMTKYQMGVVVHLKAAPKYRYFDDGDRYFYFDDAIDAKNFVLNGVPEAYKYESLIVADLSNQKNQKRYEIKSERDTMGRLVENTNRINDVFQRIINQQTFSKAYLESLKKSSSGKMPQPDTDMLDYYDSKISNDPSNESDSVKYPTFDDEYYENGGGVKKKYTRPMYPTGSRALTHANLVANKHLIEKRMHKAFSEYRFALMDLVELKKDFYKGMARAEKNYAKDNGEEYSKFEKSLTYFADAYGRRFDDGGETTDLKKGSTITIFGDEYKIIDFRVDKSQGYDEERVIMRNAEGDTLSEPLDKIMAYSKFRDSRAFSRKAKVGDVIEFQSGYADGSILRHKGKILSKEGQSYIVEVIAGGVMDGTKTYVHESLITKKFEGGGVFKVGDKVSSSMFTEGVIESKKKTGDDTMYFVTYKSSENPSKSNSTVLRASEMTKIRKTKMAKGGMAEHGLKRGDTITDDMSWEDSIVVKNEKSGTRAKVNLNTGERKEGKMAYGGKLQYNRRKK